MKRFSGPITLWHWGLAIALVLLDQGSKYWASTHLSQLHPKVIFQNSVSLQLVHNFGAAYGLFQHQRLALLAVGTVVIFVCLWFRNQLAPTPISRWGLMVLLAGTLGNYIDRVRLHYVVDFIDIRIFPVFNLADVMIDIGLGLFLLDIVYEWMKSRRTRAEA